MDDIIIIISIIITDYYNDMDVYQFSYQLFIVALTSSRSRFVIALWFWFLIKKKQKNVK